MLLRISVPAILIIFVLAFSASAGRMEQLSEKIDAEGADKIEVSIEFGAGEIILSSTDMAEVATVEVDYDPRRIECEIDYNVRRGIGHLHLESIIRRKRNIDTEKNLWEVILSNRYPMVLEIEAGACDAEMDLGGIPINELSIEIGAAAGEVDFSRPNPQRMEDFDVDAGAASLEFRNLGNANFERFNFDGGAGSFELDFRGKYTGESEISIDIGLGSAEIILPKGIPVRIETGEPGWFSSVDFHNDDLDEVRDGIYESDDFDEADIRITLELDVGLGSVDIYFKD